MNIGLFLCYARSGGTLLNQMIGCLPNAVVLSEVSPYGGGWGRLADQSPTTPAAQLEQWYGLKIPSGSYEFELAHAVEACDKLGKKLVIRDWPFVYFTPTEQNNFQPPDRFVSFETLAKLGVAIDAFALVRHPLSIWMSRGEPTDDSAFLAPYASYAEHLAALSIPMFRYEDLCKHPAQVMMDVASTLGIDASGAEWHAFNEFISVNGDVQDPRGIERHFGKQATISLSRPTPRNQELFFELHFRKELWRAARLTGYGVPSKLRLLAMAGKRALRRSCSALTAQGTRNA